MCGGWEVTAPAWPAFFDSPLGDPDGDAVLGGDGTWARCFGGGKVKVSYDPHSDTGSVSGL